MKKKNVETFILSQIERNHGGRATYGGVRNTNAKFQSMSLDQVDPFKK